MGFKFEKLFIFNNINPDKLINIPIIDIHKELFENYSDPLDLFPFRRFNHYNELGYNLVAKTILKKIKEYEKK